MCLSTRQKLYLPHIDLTSALQGAIADVERRGDVDVTKRVATEVK